jgi:hypothetical protein
MLKAFQLAVPDVAAVTHSRFGFNAKSFRVEEWRLSKEDDANDVPLLGVDLVLRCPLLA